MLNDTQEFLTEPQRERAVEPPLLYKMETYR